MDGKTLAMKVAKENEALYIERFPDWNGAEFWFMYYYEPGEDIPDIGYPQYIAVKNDQYVITDPDSAMAYIEYLDKKYGFGDDGELIGFSKNEPIKI